MKMERMKAGMRKSTENLLRIMDKLDDEKLSKSRPKKINMEPTEEAKEASAKLVEYMSTHLEEEKVENLKLETYKIGDKLSLVIDADVLYKVLKPTTNFTTWLAKTVDDYAYREDKDFVQGDSGTLLSLDMAKELCTLRNSQQGRQARDYLRQQQEKVAETIYGGVSAPVEKIAHNLPMNVPAYVAPVVKFPEATFTLNKQPKQPEEQQMTKITQVVQQKPTTQAEQAFNSISDELAAILKPVPNAVGDGTIETVNARDLHKALQVGKHYGSWITDKITKNGLVENLDYVICENLSVPKTGSSKARSQVLKDYFFTFDAAENLAMMQNNAQGQKVRRFFRETKKFYFEQQSANLITLPDFTNPAVAAMAWAEQYQAKEILQIEVAKKDELLVEQTPKVEFHDKVAVTDELYDVNSVAKLIGLGSRKFFEMLREHGYLQRNNTPYQQHVNSGLLYAKLNKYEKPLGYGSFTNHTTVTPMITGKGLTHFQKKFGA